MIPIEAKQKLTSELSMRVLESVGQTQKISREKEKHELIHKLKKKRKKDGSSNLQVEMNLRVDFGHSSAHRRWMMPVW